MAAIIVVLAAVVALAVVKTSKVSLSGLLSCSLYPELWNLLKGYTGMELLEGKLAALIVVLAVVVVLAAAAPNKQRLAFKAGNYDALSLYLGYGTNLVGMKVWLWQARSSSWHSATKEVKDKFGIVGWTYGLMGGLQILGLRGWNLGAGR